MDLLRGLNWLDLLLLVFMIISFGVGYAQGMLRQVVGLAVLYVAAILSTQYYVPLSDFMRRLFSQTSPSKFVNAFAFFVILIFVTSLLNWLALDAYRSTKLRLFPALDHLGGSLLGLVTIGIIVTLALPAVAFATGEPWPWSETARGVIVNGLQTSRLVPLFELLKPMLLDGLRPWLPAGLPSIFNL